ncbi:MAG: hypothetical protein ACOY3E_04285 [Pseudomonadota bacterium]
MEFSRVIVAIVVAPFASLLYWGVVIGYGWFGNDPDIVQGWFVLLAIPLVLGTLLLSFAYVALVCVPVHAALNQLRTYNPIWHVGFGVTLAVIAWKIDLAARGLIGGGGATFLSIPAMISLVYWLLAVRQPRTAKGFSA